MLNQRHEEKSTPVHWGDGGGGERERERERDLVLWLLFLCFFLPLGLPYVNWASQGCCLFHLRSPLCFPDLPLFYFRGLFSSLSFSHSGLQFPVLTT